MPADQSRRRIATTLAVLAALGVAGLAWLALATPQGQALDDLGRPQTPAVGRAAAYSLEFLTVVSNGFVVAAVAVLLLVALVQRRWQEALGALVLVAGANVSTQALKVLLHRPDLGIDVGAPNSLPSGHTTVAASLGTAALLVAPPRWRAAVALLAAGYAGSMGAATLFGGWHRPSDALAAIGVVTAWTLGVFAVLPLTSAIAAEHGLTPRVPDVPVTRRGRGEVAAVRLLAVGTALGVIIGLAGLVLVLAGWIGPGARPSVRYAGPSAMVLAASCVMVWASLVLAPPAVDNVVHTS